MKNEQNLMNQRHSLSHLLAAAVLEIYPDAKPTLGPPIDNGFYYDFKFRSPISNDDLKIIQEKMLEILPNWTEFTSKEVSVEEALDFYVENEFKTELINEISESGEKITFYTCGGFTDLCKGGHIENLAGIDKKSFELNKIAGAYWRGDEKNPMLTRIYGLAFETEQDLLDYKKQIEEASERDHRKIGKELELFTFSDLVGSGLPLFTPKGTALRNAVADKIYEIQSKYDFKQVWIPHITKPELYKKSGHWDKYGDELFKVQGMESDFVMKPMNCPHHTQIYASSPKSYRDLPVRFVEVTTNYRDEQTGELLGLSRVRSLTQDDGHIFCTPEQIEQEIFQIVDVIKTFYTQLGMFDENKYWVRLSIRDSKNPEKYLGDDSIWNHSEDILKQICDKENLNYKIGEGEAAFYGPKLDFMFKDAIGREWQLATIQLDFNMPSRFELEYTDKDGTKKPPVMIHRAIAGSLERFLSVMIEHFAGNFPFWMSPTQISVITINEAHNSYGQNVADILKSNGFRVEFDSSDEGFGKKVRKAKTAKIPYFVIIGDAEMESKTITLESRDAGKIGQLNIETLIQKLNQER
jgi:threonyl-tRNA synthetase